MESKTLKLYNIEEEKNKIIDTLTDNINSTFIELVAAFEMHNLGRYTLSYINDNVAVSPKVGVDLQIEPISITIIKEFKDNYPSFLSEVFHNKLVQIWNNCLDEIFSLFVRLHLLGIRKFGELKNQNIKLDFRSNDDFYLQIENRINSDFCFKEYSERQKIINKCLNPEEKRENDLRNIYKHVLIRNFIQHKNNIVDSYIIKKLGANQIQILDINGKTSVLKEGDKIILTISEINLFKQSMLKIGQIWRLKND